MHTAAFPTCRFFHQTMKPIYTSIIGYHSENPSNFSSSSSGGKGVFSVETVDDDGEGTEDGMRAFKVAALSLPNYEKNTARVTIESV
ncbi:hypothetical protein QYF36_009759 [Acer negundo]|nr:hypothetical protein QYF36_009759 [Acer negundo]